MLKSHLICRCHSDVHLLLLFIVCHHYKPVDLADKIISTFHRLPSLQIYHIVCLPTFHLCRELCNDKMSRDRLPAAAADLFVTFVHKTEAVRITFKSF